MVLKKQIIIENYVSHESCQVYQIFFLLLILCHSSFVCRSLTCDAEAVRSAGERQDVRRILVVLEETLPLGEVIVPEKIQRVCRKVKHYSINLTA